MRLRVRNLLLGYALGGAFLSTIVFSGASKAQDQTRGNTIEVSARFAEVVARWFDLLQERHRGGWRKYFDDDRLDAVEGRLDVEAQRVKVRGGGDADLWFMLRNYGGRMLRITNRNVEEDARDPSFDARPDDRRFFETCGRAIAAALSTRRVEDSRRCPR